MYRTAHAVIWRTDLRQLLPTLAIPTLVITSARDASTPPEHGEAIASLVSGAVHHRLAGGHLSPIEEADHVTSLLSAFLAEA